MLDIRSANDVLAKLRVPLSLSTMRKYFKNLQSDDNSSDMTAQQREEDF